METTPAIAASTTSGSEEITNLKSQLPKQLWFEEYYLYQWRGYWYFAPQLEGVIMAQQHFKARNDDIIIASVPKANTTWLKFLVSTIMNVSKDDDAHALTKNISHVVVNTLEKQIYVKGRSHDLSEMPSPRIFHTNMPYNVLPDSIKESNCKLVYVARDPRSVFVSLWNFFNSIRTPELGPYPIDKAFESFCDGVQLGGPIFDHVVEYWNESLNSTKKKMLFLKYEELKMNLKEEVKKLASFLGKPLVTDEEVDNVVWRCSFEILKNLEINWNGKTPSGMPHKSYLRKGEVDDWKNSFTVEMRERADRIV